jgi:hypothetical protein
MANKRCGALAGTDRKPLAPAAMGPSSPGAKAHQEAHSNDSLSVKKNISPKCNAAQLKPVIGSSTPVLTTANRLEVLPCLLCQAADGSLYQVPTG